MTYYRCKCGKCEYFGSGMFPEDCQGCDECGTNLATSSEKHKPVAEHEWIIRYNEITGESYLRCKKCYQKKENEVEKI